jgi:hypothetical protein
VLNAADPTGRDNEEARSVLQDMDGIKILPGIVVRRKAFRNAASQGRGVLDNLSAKTLALVSTNPTSGKLKKLSSLTLGSAP